MSVFRTGRFRRVKIYCDATGKFEWQTQEMVNIGGNLQWSVHQSLASTKAFKPRGHLADYAYDEGPDPPLPSESTECEPGSPEKIEVMRARAESGVQIHHPDDVSIHPQSENHAFIKIKWVMRVHK